MRIGLVVVLVAAALSLAASAAATVVPQKGMAGVRLGMTKVKVEQVLGMPLRTVTGSNDFGSYTQLRYPRRIVVTFQGDATVTAIETRGIKERTASGVGVQSSEAELKAGVNRLKCRTEFGFRHCWRGRFLPGQRVTDFRINTGGRVSAITIGFVID